MIINWNDRRRVNHASLVLLPGEFVYRVGAVLNQPIVNNDYVLFRPVNYLLRVHGADRGVICIRILCFLEKIRRSFDEEE